MIIRLERTARKLFRKCCNNVNNILSITEMEIHSGTSDKGYLSVKQRYDDVIAALNCLQSNSAVLGKIKPNRASQSPNIENTNKYLKRCGINLDLLNGRVIHVSGTKGKGSTCALTEAILRSHSYTTGFYSSPHLFSVTERIRINGKPISQEKFTEYFWEIYNILDNNKDDEHDMPTYFKFLTVLAFKVFISEEVDVAIIEVGIGGEFDCTNSLRHSSVIGVTSLGFDHMAVLGNTIEEIAWNKAGIMKKDCLAFTCNDQPASALEIIRSRALEKQCSLFVIERDINLECLNVSNKLLELNSALAVHLAHAWIYLKTGLSPFPSDPPRWEGVLPLSVKTLEGLRNCLWPGRFQVVPRGDVTYYLDGAHTDESMTFCTQWFSQTVPKSGKKVLVFNLTGSRDAKLLLQQLAGCGFDLACFCPNLLNSKSLNDNLKVVDSMNRVLSLCEKNAEIWQEVTGQEGKVFSSVNENLSTLEGLQEGPLHVLITGSLHLVGNSTCYLQPDIWN